MLLKGVLFMMSAGIFWVFSGVTYSYAARNSISVNKLQGAAAILGILLMLGFAIADPVWAPRIFLAGFGAGTLNSLVYLLTDRAMRSGPSGTIWSLMQSALVFPFAMGIILGNTQITAMRIAGIIALVSGVVFLGRDKGRSTAAVKVDAGRIKWQVWAMLSWVAAGVTQCLANLPSYPSYTGAEISSPLWRNLASHFGALTTFLVVYWVFRRDKAEREVMRPEKKRQFTWLLILLTFIQVGVAYVFLYPGLDALAAANCGSVGYPLGLSCCIIGFVIWSTLAYREKVTWQRAVGVAMIFAGIVLISL